MVYEIWRDDSLNLSAAFSTEREALAALREEVIRNGPEAVLRSVLVKANPRGDRIEVAEGRQLVERALSRGNPKAVPDGVLAREQRRRAS